MVTAEDLKNAEDAMAQSRLSDTSGPWLSAVHSPRDLQLFCVKQGDVMEFVVYGGDGTPTGLAMIV
eukprot:10963957-Karenia_brevis.AAC.1